MNIPRRIAALRRNIEHRRIELERIGKLREIRDAAILAFPVQVEAYLERIGTEMGQLECELKVLEQHGIQK